MSLGDAQLKEQLNEVFACVYESFFLYAKSFIIEFHRIFSHLLM